MDEQAQQANAVSSPLEGANTGSGILDPMDGGRPIRFNPFLQLGRSGLRQYGGFVLEDFLPNLRGSKGAEQYRELVESSPIVGGVYRLIQLTLRQVKRVMEPFSDDPEDVERCEMTEQMFDDMSYTWEDTKAEIASMLPYGYAPMEICYKKRDGVVEGRPGLSSRYDDGLIGWRKFALRAQDSLFRWIFDDEQEVLAFVQLAPPDYRFRVIPIDKLALFRPSVEKENPEGKSILRSGFVNWIMIKRLTEVEAIAGERWATGVPVMSIPAASMQSTAEADKAAVYTYAKKVVTNLRVDEQAGVVLPMAWDPLTKMPLYDLKMLSVNGTQFDYDKPIRRHEVRLAMSMMADVAMLGQDKVGSFALARDKRTMLADGIGAWHDSIDAVFNRHVIPRMWALNGWPVDRLCKMGHGEVQSSSLDELSSTALRLSQAGMALFPDEKLESHIRHEAGWPERSETPYDVQTRQGKEQMGLEQPEEGEEGVDGELSADGAEGDTGESGGNPGSRGARSPGDGGRSVGNSREGRVGERKKYSGQPRHRRGTYGAPSAASITAALEVLRDRQTVGGTDEVAHGLRTEKPAPFDPKTMTSSLNLSRATLRRVPIKELVATQPTVRRETVRGFLERPGVVVPGQRDLTGRLVDRPVGVSHGGKVYVADGHHRIAAARLLGQKDVIMRVVEEPVVDVDKEER